MKSVAIVYATREGQTKKVAERVASGLRGRRFHVWVKNAADRQAPIDLNQCDAAILAASVHRSEHESEMVRFVKEHKARLESIPTAFLSVNLSEAIVERPGQSQERREHFEVAVREAINRFVEETGWHPNHIKAIAGALPYSKYNLVIRFILKRVAKSAGADTDTTHDYEYTDWAAVDHFVEELAKEFATIPV